MSAFVTSSDEIAEERLYLGDCTFWHMGQFIFFFYGYMRYPDTWVIPLFL